MMRFRPINGSGGASILENVETQENSLTDQEDNNVDQLIERIKRVRFAQNYPS
jgi:hypothetical protein